MDKVWVLIKEPYSNDCCAYILSIHSSLESVKAEQDRWEKFEYELYGKDKNIPFDQIFWRRNFYHIEEWVLDEQSELTKEEIDNRNWA